MRKTIIRMTPIFNETYVQYSNMDILSIATTTISFIIILGILVIIHELGHFLAARRMGVRVEEFGFGFPPRAWGKKIGETLYSINWLPIGGFVKVFGEEYHEDGGDMSKQDKKEAFVYKKPWQKAFILVAGVVMNFILGWVLISFLFTRGIPVPTGKVVVDTVAKGSPAEATGVKNGDQILSITYQDRVTDIRSIEELARTAQKYGDTEIQLTLKSAAGETKRVEVTPRKNPPAGQGSLGITLDIDASYVVKTYPWYQAPYYGLLHSVDISLTFFRELGKIFGQMLSMQKPSVEFTGPVGIAQYTGQAIQVGPEAVIQLIALLSLNLAVVNLLPFPALDGGRLVFVIYEWVTRKRVHQDFERNLNLFGIIVLLTLTVVITYFDIVKLFR